MMKKKKKIHIANWDMVCRPKFVGVLGLKKASMLSKALLAKSSWRLLQNEGLMVSKLDMKDTWKGILYWYPASSYRFSMESCNW